MRKVFFIISILVSTTMAMQAQNKLGYFIEDNIQIGAKQHGMTTVMDNLLVGIEPVKNLKVMFDWQGTLGLYDKNDVKTYYQGTAIGGGLGYRLLPDKEEKGLLGSKDALDVRALFTTTIGKPDWKYNQYSIGLTLYGYDKGKIRPTVGVGYRYIDSKTAGIRSQSTIFFELGLKL